MLSVEECKRVLGSNFSDEEVIEMRDTLYQFANILIQKYIDTKE
jgi:hypothetical protein